MDYLSEHVAGEFSCSMCDKPPEQCENCGGMIHFEVEEESTPFSVATMLEEAECDVCGPDYIL